MERLNKIITAVLASKISIAIYVLMFIYLVPVPLVAMLPGMEWLMPTTAAMLVGDNYTSVLAALGASIASLAGVSVHQDIKEHRVKHDQMQQSINDLHTKIDKLTAEKAKE
ncbi:MAG: hypothetical protein LBG75_01040 [Candidatus Nomurabacteria bacterium]|jgi:hypothetical protein|nr:hypothetical protein [Candidatus Nomurabacteria bacterium]